MHKLLLLLVAIWFLGTSPTLAQLPSRDDLWIIDYAVSKDHVVIMGICELADGNLHKFLQVYDPNRHTEPIEITIDRLSYGSTISQDTLYVLCKKQHITTLETYNLESDTPKLTDQRICFIDTNPGYLFEYQGNIYHLAEEAESDDPKVYLFKISDSPLAIEKCFSSIFPNGELAGFVLANEYLHIIYNNGQIVIFNLQKEVLEKPKNNQEPITQKA
jgi:hypothetical protein